jgi:hypothetical protein
MFLDKIAVQIGEIQAAPSIILFCKLDGKEAR